MAATNDHTTAALPDLAAPRRSAALFAAEVRRRFGKRIRKVRLYGSAARGDWTDESDVDVLILLSDMDTGDAGQVSEMAFHVGAVETGVLLRPLVMAPEQFEHLLARERGLALDIQHEGIDL